MSQAKAIVKTIRIPVDQFKPSPYQPRLAFNLEDIRGSIKRDGILVPLTVRKKDGYYELIDGERRVRLAKELGYKSVPCTVIDVDDETARRLVYKVNKERKNYTPYEEAVFFKKLVEEEKMKPYQIETELGASHHWVQACLNVWKFPEDIQKNVFGPRASVPYKIYMSDIRELEDVINRNIDEATTILREVIKKRMTTDEKRELISRRRKKISEETVEKAEEAIEEVAPELKKPETPEEFEEAAKALMEEAKRRKTPEQILEEKREEARKSLLTGKGNAQSKIEKAKEEGSDTSELERRLEEIKAKISTNPEEALEETKLLKEEVDKVRKEHKARVKAEKSLEKVESEIENAEELGLDMGELKERYDEVKNTIFSNPNEASKKFEKLAQKAKEMIEDFEREQREAKIREEARREAEIEARAKLMEDEEFLKRATEKAEELTSYPEIPRIEPQSSIEIPIELRERAREMEEEYQAFLLRKDVKERGGDFENWMAHNYLLGALLSVRCPICGKGGHNLVWACGDHEALDIREATEKLRKKLEAS